MHVIVTAGHVDHGKSTLVNALTGMEPDRLAEERRRGLSIGLGYCWTRFDGVGDVAFVDVPGHERFISTMLAGVSAISTVLFAVAADDPWMPQAAEHLAALDALGLRHAVIAVTRADLVDAAQLASCFSRVKAELDKTTLRGAAIVPVSALTGFGMNALRKELSALLIRLPAADPTADVRLWVDRRFTVKGAGTIVTGTLASGSIRRNDLLTHGTHQRTVKVRGLEVLGRPIQSVSGVARVALNLTGDVSQIERGSPLMTPKAFLGSTVVDVRISGDANRVPRAPILHLGTTAVETRFRALSGYHARITATESLPLRIGDRALLRDPGSRSTWGICVLDPAPPSLNQRGAARVRGAELERHPGVPDVMFEIERREVVELNTLRQLCGPFDDLSSTVTSTAGWVMSAERAARAVADLETAVLRHHSQSPLDPGLSLSRVAQQIDLPSAKLVPPLLRAPFHVRDGRVVNAHADAATPELESAVGALCRELVTTPFAAPSVTRVGELGFDTQLIAAASSRGAVLQLSRDVLLLPGADALAATWLADLPQPFTASEARIRLDTSRRVIVPLLEHLERTGVTEQLADGRHRLAARDPG